jgi:type VI protein secretion system component VasF
VIRELTVEAPTASPKEQRASETPRRARLPWSARLEILAVLLVLTLLILRLS